jgi:predicted flap endonuclease-1-like 5' DNA nuclease
MVRFLLVVVGLAVASAGVALLIWILWLLWKRSERERQGPAMEIEIPSAPPGSEGQPVEAPVESSEPTPVEVEAQAPPPKADDLKRIEGIGPKISSVLAAAGITTFAQLADANVEQLRQILETADPRLLRLVDPASWPQQAGLAAGGEWDALSALQNQLRGGRRV